jgi:segregation and condensation protein B
MTMSPPRLTLVSTSLKADEVDVRDADALEAAEKRAAEPAGAIAASIADATGRNDCMRILEALLFAASEPLDEKTLAQHLSGENIAIGELLEELKAFYRGRGINLVRVAGKWAFRTSEDLSYLLEKHAKEERRLSKAALETLAIVAYHQPVTRAEIEEIRGVSTSVGTIDILMETGWIRPRGRRRAPGKPITYGTTEAFLTHFSLDSIKDLPGLAELKGAGLLDGNLPPGFTVPEPTDIAALMPDELPLETAEDEDVQAEMELDLPEEGEPDKSEAEDK